MKKYYLIYVASITLMLSGCGNVNGASSLDKFALEQIELESQKIKVEYPQKKFACVDYEKLGYCQAR
jgi:hypothetical protein